jgi:hypothetical protein
MSSTSGTEQPIIHNLLAGQVITITKDMGVTGVNVVGLDANNIEITSSKTIPSGSLTVGGGTAIVNENTEPYNWETKDATVIEGLVITSNTGTGTVSLQV